MRMYFCLVLVCYSATTLHATDATPAPLLTMRSEPIGIPNIGNSCFMNATLQALMSLTLLTEDLINTSEKSIQGRSDTIKKRLMEKDSKSEKDANKFSQFYQHYYEFTKIYQKTSENGILAKSTTKFFQTLDSEFKLGEQENSGEFFKTVLLSLQHASPYKTSLFLWEVHIGQLLKNNTTKETPNKWTMLPFWPSCSLFTFFESYYAATDGKLIKGKPVFIVDAPAIYLFLRAADQAVCPFLLEKLILPASHLKDLSTNFPLGLSFSLRSLVLRSKGAPKKERSSGHYIAMVRYGDIWWIVNDSSTQQLDRKTMELLAQTGKWGEFSAELLCYECFDVGVFKNKIWEESRLTFVKKLEYDIAQRRLLKQFQRDLNLITTLASLQKE